MALKPENPVVGGTVLRRQAIQSPNYVPGVSGWAIKQDGSAEFNNLTIRGTFFGTDLIINSVGGFFYFGAPALGNLAESIVPGTATVADPEGNTAQPGVTAYQVGNTAVWVQLLEAAVNFSDPGMTVAATVDLNGPSSLVMNSGQQAADTAAQVAVSSQVASGVSGGLVNLQAGEVSTNATIISAPNATAINFDTATIDLKNGNLNVNMADPPNTAAVIAGTATQAQYNACLGGMLNSMKNRQFFA